MKHFLKSVFIFFLPIIFGLFFCFLGLNILSILAIKNSDNYRFDEKINLVFLGDSHVTHAVIDSNITNSINLATNAEPYYYTYQKLKFLKNKIKLNNVVLGFSYHNTSSYYDDLINGSSSGNLSKKIFFCFSNLEKIRLLNWNKNKLIYFIKNIFFGFKNKKHLFADGYLSLKSNQKMLTPFLNKRIKHQFYKKNQVLDYSSINLYYLNKIINFCTKNKIKLTLLTTPLHKDYIKNVPEKFKLKYKELTKNNNINLVDLQNIQISDSCFAYDGDHVTTRGAEELTRELIKHL